MKPHSDDYLKSRMFNDTKKNNVVNNLNSNNHESVDNINIILGETTECVDPSCRGLLVDSVVGRYYIRCSDDRHNHELMEIKNQKAGLGAQTKTAASDNTTRFEVRPGDTNE